MMGYKNTLIVTELITQGFQKEPMVAALQQLLVTVMPASCRK